MFQAAGDLRLQQEAGTADWIVGELGLDFLERDLACQFVVLRHGNLAQSTLGVRTQDAKPHALCHRIALRRQLRAVEIGIHYGRTLQGDLGRGRRMDAGRRPGNTGQSLLDIGISYLLQRVTYRPNVADRRDTLLEIVIVLFQVFADQRLKQISLLVGQVATVMQ